MSFEGRFSTVDQWLKDCAAKPDKDWDCVILFSGDEGSGKSKLCQKVMAKLDPSLDVDRICMGIEEYLGTAPIVPKKRAVVIDEILANARKGMHGATIELLDDLQISRGRNHFVGICFPHEDLFDKGILNYRIRWKVHVVNRGFFRLYSRERRIRRTRWGEEFGFFVWRERGAFTYTAKDTDLWLTYLAKKEDLMAKRLQVVKKAEYGGLDYEVALSFAKRIAAKYKGRGENLESLALGSKDEPIS